MKKTLTILLVLALTLGLLAGCGSKPAAGTEAPAESEAAVSEQPAETSAQPAAGAEVNLAVLSGPTGVGAAKLLYDSDAGESVNHYNYTVCTDNQQVMAGLTNGDFDIAAIATNVAATLYNKSGSIQLLALNTLGVLYILGPADQPIQYLGDLRGKTLYATGQGANPQYALNYLLSENGLDPETDVNVVWGTADEVNVAMLQGDADYCMLPVPAATALEAKSEGAVKSYISLSDEWDALKNGSQLTMGCVVVRTQFAQENPEAVEAFLDEYAASIAYMADPANLALSDNANPAKLVADYGIAPSEGVAVKAIPQCNLVCITGTEMRDTIQGYYSVLCDADPASIGGAIPDDAFYFLGR